MRVVNHVDRVSSSPSFDHICGVCAITDGEAGSKCSIDEGFSLKVDLFIL